MWTSYEKVGILVIPTLLFVLFFVVPFIDRRLERRPWRRPVAMGAFLFVLLSYIGLGSLSYYNDYHTAPIAAQLRLQQKDTERYMRAAFQPQFVGARPPEARAEQASPSVAQGKAIFEAHACSGCHGEGGVGTAVAPRLIGISKKFTADELANMLRHRTAAMMAGGMPPVNVTDAQLKALVAYLDSLK